MDTPTDSACHSRIHHTPSHLMSLLHLHNELILAVLLRADGLELTRLVHNANGPDTLARVDPSCRLTCNSVRRLQQTDSTSQLSGLDLSWYGSVLSWCLSCCVCHLLPQRLPLRLNPWLSINLGIRCLHWLSSCAHYLTLLVHCK